MDETSYFSLFDFVDVESDVKGCNRYNAASLSSFVSNENSMHVNEKNVYFISMNVIELNYLLFEFLSILLFAAY